MIDLAKQEFTRTTNNIASLKNHTDLRFFTALSSRLSYLINELKNRKEIKKLLSATPHQLADIGINRFQLIEALKLPLSQSAGSWLQNHSHKRNSLRK